MEESSRKSGQSLWLDVTDKPQHAEIGKISKQVACTLGHKLSTLSVPNDIVGIQSRVEELERLLILVAIKKLENVENGSEALEARMMDKKHIQHLVLRWSVGEDCMDSQTEMDILCKLEPHQDLESLEINGYRSTRYLDWVRKPCYHNMTKLKLSGCNNCFTLPPLGHLPSLRDLTISDWKMLEKVDDSFFNNNDHINDGTIVPFASLESLEFDKMPCWEVWSCCEQPGAFPKLKRLVIWDCPKLKGDLPSDLPALEQLEIKDCEQLTCSDPLGASALLEITIVEANKFMESVFAEGGMPLGLRLIKISYCEKLLLSGLSIASMDKLIHLGIRGPCDGVKSFPNINEGLLLPASLPSDAISI